jgi:hypothetical protein
MKAKAGNSKMNLLNVVKLRKCEETLNYFVQQKSHKFTQRLHGG